jgi:mono/diheme cytochrome c family protein
MVRFTFAALLIAAPLRAADAPVDFSRDVLPVLSDYCFQCHGPDANSRKAKLRFDDKNSPFDRGVIVPGKPKESSLIDRLTSTDPDAVMPPPSLKRKLSPQQIAAITKWVEQGAKWSMHWAFEPIAKPARKSIDDFTRGKLGKEADNERLRRRVTFDLTGLPPSVAEMDAFLKDDSPKAYEKVVDRLLASPRYGERMAAEWLDVARFADTHGYQMDRTRPVWPYRDWVISAFNRGMPFDQFATWQIAGDLIPNATKESRLATAFNRLHMQNEEGGIVEEEFRVAYVNDRVTTFGTAFLGLTFECSRCHDHKFDPISMKDYYSLFAFFQNIDESGQTSYFTAATPVPALLLSTDEQDKKIAELKDVILQKSQALASLTFQAQGAFSSWKRPEKLDSPGLVGWWKFNDLKAAKVPNKADAKTPATAADNPKLEADGVRLSGEDGFVFPGVGHFTRDDPFSIQIRVKPPVDVKRAVLVHHSQAPIDAGSRGYELLIEDGKVAFGLHHMWPGNSLKVRAKEPLRASEWTRITVCYDGSSRAEGVKVYLDEKPAAIDVIRDKLTKDITYGGEPNLAVGYRFRDNGFKNGLVDELKVWNRAITLAEIVEKPTDGMMYPYFADAVYEPNVKAKAELRAARKAYTAFINPIPEIMVMDEMPTPKPAYILKRGAYDSRGEQVTADTPKALPPFPKDAPRNRLGLAQWLTDPGNPLFARVTVNRAWQMMFGQGLVPTSDNFGTQGARPSDPELLDWLARDFIEHKWDLKRLLKQIAMSATYRQATGPQFPAKRLTAEMLRDQALAASGLLVEKLGGPSVKPYQPAGLWEEIAMGRPHYDQSKGPDLYRRSLYTFWKRTVPPPAMATFDAADRSVCTVSRQSTSTPLQALVLLNDVQFVEASRFVGERMLKDGGATDADRVSFAFRLITSRSPSEKERTVLMKLFVEQKSLFEKNPAAVKKLLTVGDKPASALSAELAAATVLANVLFNHDEAVMRR